MNTFIHIAASACLAGSMLASVPVHAAADPSRPRIVIDCERPRLPTQREVGELLDQHNFAQVYASRAALMAEAHRICRRGPVQARRVAFEAAATPPPEERRIATDRHGR